VLTIDSAPPGFAFVTPYIASSNITAAGDFYINNLPAGNYSVTATDECGFVNSDIITIVGYAIDASNFSLQTNCGTFDLNLDFVSNGNANETFWLQKLLNETSNTWGHPVLEVVYNENAIPDATNSFQLINNAINYNLAFNGTFRILRNFYSYNNGNDFNNALVSSTDKSCVEILQPTFEFNESLEIVNAYRLPCSASGSLDVVLEVNGPLPLQYRITEKDGIAFIFDNGTSNIFYNLDPGVYTFEVRDLCGNIVPRQFDVAALGSLITVTKPDDSLNCVPTITGNETFDLTAFSPIILGTQSPLEYSLNYYTSIEDAQAGTNAISTLATFNPSSDFQTIYATVRFNPLPNCYEITDFDLYVGQTPQINLNASYLKCDDAPVMIDATGNNLLTTTYQWSNGSTDSSVSVSQLGITNLTVTATNTYGTNLVCTASKDIEIIISIPPVIDRIETVDWTDAENIITVISSTPEQFEYALDNGSFQSGNVFTNLTPGLYNVSIRDKFGCGTITKQVWLLNYPKFFTPNGDGYHDLWFIENAENEPDFKVFVFDRYGKLLKSFGSKDVGWDGIYNGREIFSEDYWFVVQRQDGRVLKGHFTLKR
jgi:gliding motility-associated-like protein